MPSGNRQEEAVAVRISDPRLARVLSQIGDFYSAPHSNPIREVLKLVVERVEWDEVSPDTVKAMIAALMNVSPLVADDDQHDSDEQRAHEISMIFESEHMDICACCRRVEGPRGHDKSAAEFREVVARMDPADVKSLLEDARRMVRS